MGRGGTVYARFAIIGHFHPRALDIMWSRPHGATAPRGMLSPTASESEVRMQRNWLAAGQAAIAVNVALAATRMQSWLRPVLLILAAAALLAIAVRWWRGSGVIEEERS